MLRYWSKLALSNSRQHSNAPKNTKTMNLKKLTLGLCALTVSLSAVGVVHAYVNDNLPYARVSALLISPDSDFVDDGAGAMLAIGTQFGGTYGGEWQQQIELEVGYGELDLGTNPLGATGDLETVPVLFTYRAVWTPSDALHVSFGPSVGMNYLRGRITVPLVGTGSDTDWVFSYGLGALASWNVSERVTVDAGYRYLWNEDANFGGFKVTDIEAHVFELGLRFRWPD